MSLKRREFSKQECKEIKKLLAEKLGAPSNDQKRIRAQLRNKYGFWISFFTDERPFSEDHFNDLLKRKVITCREQ
jgi:hypothetical protein